MGSRRSEHKVSRYPRTARLNEVIRQVIAEHVEEIEDARLELITITGIETDPDLRHAKVFFSSFNQDDAPILEAFEELRPKLQRFINAEMTLKRTPILEFARDSGVVSGTKIEEILRDTPRFEVEEIAEDVYDVQKASRIEG
jgi:ribosome-binding factor A